MENDLMIENQNHGLVEDQQRDIKYTKLFVLPRFTLGVIAQILVYLGITYLHSLLSLHLDKYGFNTVWIGVFFALPDVIYAATSALVFLMT